ncbi:DUF4926 domain-containing protein [Variovorax sp. GB4P3]
MFSKVRYIGPKDFCSELNFGDIGYVIEDYGQGNYEIEFSLPDGSTKAQLGISESLLEQVKPP